jgi:hypothetical protein
LNRVVTIRFPRALASVIAGYLICAGAPASAADSQDEGASLGGLKAISVVVEELSPVAAPSLRKRRADAGSHVASRHTRREHR